MPRMTRMAAVPILILATAIAACESAGPAAPAPPAPPRAPAVSPAERVAALKGQLQQELQEAMKVSPQHAITVCRDRAPRIAAGLSSDGIAIGRTSARVRNPANAPRGWVEPVLADFAAHPENRAPRTLELPGGGTGYVEPIVVQPLCLVCHGEAVSPDVEAALDRLYPADRATGYRAGDFRGVFWVESDGVR